MMSETWMPARMPTRPERLPPRGAWDTHTHVFAPEDRFSLAFRPDFALPFAPVAWHRRMWAQIGLDGGIFVQPAHYGFDHGALLDALGQTPGGRGVALAGAGVTEEQLDTLHAAGVRALRFTEFRNPDGSVRPGSVGVDQLYPLASRLAERNWHVQIWASATQLDAMLPDLDRLGLPVVIDHMGMMDPATGVESSTFKRMVDRLREGRLWVKLSVCRLSTMPNYEDVRPFHDALVAANPDRLLWASDWPFIRMGAKAPDIGQLLDLFTLWIGDPAVERAILCDNPAKLFGFD